MKEPSILGFLTDPIFLGLILIAVIVTVVCSLEATRGNVLGEKKKWPV